MSDHESARRPLGGGYEDLRVWQAAVELAAECYVRTAAFPSAERFGLTAQMRRAAVSVVSNIAEGHGRGTNGSFAQSLSVARGSVKELEAQATLSVRLGLAGEDEVRRLRMLCVSTGRMLHALRKSLVLPSAPRPRPPTPDAFTREAHDGRRPAADASIH